MNVLIVGAGSVGSVVGGFMAQSGHAVTLLGRAAHMDAVRENGLRITGIWGDHHVTDMRCETSVDALDGTFDFIVIAVKAYDTRAAAESIKPFLGPDSLVLSYQNGLGNAEILADVLGPGHVLDARVIYGVWMPEPGRADVTVTADATMIGCYHESVPLHRVEQIAAAMDEAGIPTRATDRIATYLWSKVAYNCSLNPMSALLDVPYGGLLDSEDTKALMKDIVHELYAVGHAMNIELKPATPDEYIELLFGRLIPTTAGHYASMHEDFRRKRRTEIDALNGAIVRFGIEHGIACPTNDTLAKLVRARTTFAMDSAPKQP